MFYYGEVKYMKKYLYMGAGIIVGGAIALVMYNTKPIKQYIKKCKNSLMVSLDDAMDELMDLVDSISEEKVKQKLKNKYNYYKRKIEKIDFENLEESMKEKVSALISEIRDLIVSTENMEGNI